ncbi:phosphotransferase family protein [Microlunatus sp. GCM10028923]|uniref:phosphotransferase family protein n=1 Tax=Microlunatus sp. GCM10028923 TaxID=3273400 RepID=UPI00361F369B
MGLTPEITAWIRSETGAGVSDSRPLYTWRPGAPQLLELDSGGQAVLRQAPGRVGRHDGFAHESAAMIMAEEHRVPAPRLIAVDLDGSVAGHPALLMTAVPGTSRIPGTATVERLEALGRGAAMMARIRTEPTPDLPAVTGPIDIGGGAAGRRRAVRWEAATEPERQAMVDDLCAATGWDPERARRTIPDPEGGRSRLLEDAAELLDRLPVPAGEPVLVHGDLWQGNTMWDGDRLTALIDWDSAGVGHPGIDLGCVRHDAVLFFGAEAAGPVLAGWEQATGTRPDPATVAYWDVRVALNTTADMIRGMDVAESYGRPEVTPELAALRRDAFLEAGLRGLG